MIKDEGEIQLSGRWVIENIGTWHRDAMQSFFPLLIMLLERSSIIKMWKNQKCRKRCWREKNALSRRTGFSCCVYPLSCATATEPEFLMRVIWAMCISLIWGLILPFSHVKGCSLSISPSLFQPETPFVLGNLTIIQLIPKVPAPQIIKFLCCSIFILTMLCVKVSLASLSFLHC